MWWSNLDAVQSQKFAMELDHGLRASEPFQRISFCGFTFRSSLDRIGDFCDNPIVQAIAAPSVGFFQDFLRA